MPVNHGGDLFFAVGIPGTISQHIVRIPGVNDFDTNGGIIQVGPAVPATDAGMPRPPVFVNQLQNHGLTLYGFRLQRDQIVRADLVPGQRLQGAAVIQCRIVHNQKAYPVILTDSIKGMVNIISFTFFRFNRAR